MDTKLATFNELEHVLKILYISIVGEENLNPMNFYISDKNLFNYLKGLGNIDDKYCHDLFVNFSTD